MRPIEIDAITFDDYDTLRYSSKEYKEDIIHSILRSIMKKRIDLNEKNFLREYYHLDRSYRKRLEESCQEIVLDKIVSDTMKNCNLSIEDKIVQSAIDEVLKGRRSIWYQDSVPTLSALKKRGYILGVISNTHWRWLKEDRDAFKKHFQTISLSYEIGYAKPHSVIFIATLKKIGVKPERCLHVGDDPVVDIKGAKNVGMRTAFIRRGNLKANSDIQLKKLSELLDIL